MDELHTMGNGEINMILKAKIKKEHLDEILNGNKKAEYRQFDGNDIMEVTDETGRTRRLKITGAREANEKLQEAVMARYNKISWKKIEPIIVFGVEPIEEPKISEKGLV